MTGFNYGSAFQSKLIACLLTDKVFLQQIVDILSPSYFDNESIQWICKELIGYFKEYKIPPTIPAYKIMLKQETTFPDSKRLEIVNSLKDIIKNLDATDLEYVKKTALSFCKNQCIRNAILESADLLETANYDKIKSIIDNSMKAGQAVGSGYNYMSNVRERYTTEKRKASKTKWRLVNEITQGGFGPGELIVVAAPPGIGKSTLLMNIGSHAICRGETVVHYTLELDENYTAKKYDSIITEISSEKLEYNLDTVEQRLKDNVTGELIIQYYPDNTATINTIKAHLDNLITVQGKVIDKVIVDYADKLKPSAFFQKQHEALGDIYKELRGLAGEYKIPLFTASQIGRGDTDAKVATGDQISGSYEKIMIADFVMSLTRKITDKLAGTGLVHIIKNRFGPDGQTFPTKVDMSIGSFEIHEAETVKGKEVVKQQNNGDTLLKQDLFKSFKKMQKDFG